MTATASSADTIERPNAARLADAASAAGTGFGGDRNWRTRRLGTAETAPIAGARPVVCAAAAAAADTAISGIGCGADVVPAVALHLAKRWIFWFLVVEFGRLWLWWLSKWFEVCVQIPYKAGVSEDFFSESAKYVIAMRFGMRGVGWKVVREKVARCADVPRLCWSRVQER